ncbi:hypothetical protein CONLIGDRAFT_628396 [Coniochaeta ligniaria NRRL 30616]|uniref:DUF1640-domain-containing protein n=1 Tax=Coniochaeta ligniaria NRRL 30616 TaxID=1408157 RepID=A0A1J7J280_9PEZI|nr:hypothetical protein CONLIGDRAFT_628396 [Coniochaeta ligniaria NRRL 30616]
MSNLRLTFLYPHLYRSFRIGEPAVQRATAARHNAARSPRHPCCQYAAPMSTSTSRRQTAKRHGKAVEPLPLYTESDTPLSPASSLVAQAKSDSQTPKPNEPASQSAPIESESETAPPPADKPSQPSETIELPPPPPSDPQETPSAQPGSNTEAASAPPPPSADQTSTGPMETILHMGPPDSGLQDISGTPTRPPHLSPPPYVHHFDSYSLVKQLESGGWTNPQAITAMKAVRGLLAVNLDVAQAGLVSKSDVENETYLFRAACSELSTEVRKNRRVADESMRQQRTTLQHEVDILTQSLNQEVLTLNDAVKGMFNDRRMAVREEQKAAESAIQQLNYKITVMLNSDARSEVEGLRWVLIRRSVLGIVFMAFLIFSSLRYGSYVSHERAKEKERLAKEAENMRRDGGRLDHSSAPAAAEILAAS